MIRFCRALHRRIVYTGRLCPLCHEIEINLELMHELRQAAEATHLMRTQGGTRKGDP